MIWGMIIMCLFLLVWGLYFSKKFIVAPYIITPFIWLVCFILWVILNHDLPTPSNNFFICITIWICGFTISSMFTDSLSTRLSSSKKEPSKLVRDIFLLLCVITTLFFLAWSFESLRMDVDMPWALKLRYASLGMKDGKIYGGLQVFLWQVTYLIELYYYDKKKWYRTAIPATSYLLYSFLTMSKAGFLNIFIMSVSLLILKNGNSIIKKFFPYIILLIVVFFTLQTLRIGSQSSKNDTVILYALSSIVAFDTLEPYSAQYTAENTGVFFYRMANKLGLSDIPPKKPILPFIEKPIITNTYTVLYPFYVDFGRVGIAVFAVILGLLAGLFFGKSKHGYPAYSILYSYLTTVVIMQYAAETFLTNLSGHIMFVFLLSIPFIFGKKVQDTDD